MSLATMTSGAASMIASSDTIRGQSRQRAEDVAPAAEAQSLAEEVAVGHREIRSFRKLHEHAYRGRTLRPGPQRGEPRLELRRRRGSRSLGPGKRADGDDLRCDVGQLHGLHCHHAEAQVPQPLHVSPADCPTVHASIRSGLQRRDGFIVDAKRVAHPRQGAHRRRKIAEFHHPDQPVAGAGRVNKLREMGRQRHDALRRRERRRRHSRRRCSAGTPRACPPASATTRAWIARLVTATSC